MKKPAFVVYPFIGRWFWRLECANGVVTAHGAASYRRKSDCLRAVNRALIAIFDADIEVQV